MGTACYRRTADQTSENSLGCCFDDMKACLSRPSVKSFRPGTTASLGSGICVLWTWKPRNGGSAGCDAPDRIADVVRDQKSAAFVHHHADGTALRVAVSIEEAGEHILGHSLRPAILERHEDHLVAVRDRAIPRTMLTDEGAAPVLRGQQRPLVEGQPERSSVRAQRIVRHNRL